MDDTAKLYNVLESLKQVEEKIRAEREADDFRPITLKMLVNKRERLSMERDILQSKIRKWQ